MTAWAWCFTIAIALGFLTYRLARATSREMPPYEPPTQREWLDDGGPPEPWRPAGNPDDPNDAEALYLAHRDRYADSGGMGTPDPAAGRELPDAHPHVAMREPGEGHPPR